MGESSLAPSTARPDGNLPGPDELAQNGFQVAVGVNLR